MKILVTGANGFVGKNLVLALEQLMNGNDRTRNRLQIDELFCYDINDSEDDLDYYCSECDFVFNLAGVNRPTDVRQYMEGNFMFLSDLLKSLAKYNNRAPVMLSSSVQASLIGRYAESEYGKSKLAAEQLLRRYGQELNIATYIYRFPNIFPYAECL